MKIRTILWFRTEEEYGRFPYLFATYTHGEWFIYSFLDTSKHTPTRAEFEKHYLEWKSKNES